MKKIITTQTMLFLSGIIAAALFLYANPALGDDTTPPTPPVILSPQSHDITMCPLAITWDSSDTESGVAGYSFAIDTIPDTIVDTISEGVSASTTYNNLAKGTYYFHVAAVDTANNWSATTHFGITVNKTAFLLNDFIKGDESTPIILYLVPVFEAKGVNLYINGHNHFYQRAYKNGVYYLSPGSGGSPLHTPLIGGPENTPELQVSKKTFGHAVITTGADKITVTDYDMTNSINDIFNIKKPGVGDEPLPPGPTIPATTSTGSIIPYLQDVTQASVKVMWLSAAAENSRVDYGLTTTYGSVSQDPAAVTIHKITLSGLQPDTIYHYKVTSGTSPATADSIFRTAPAGSDSGFTFIAYGDTRPQAYGPTPAPDHAAVCASIAAHNPGTFILNNGDVTNDAAQNQWIPNFFDPARDIIKNNATYMCVGNHETNVPANTHWFDDYFSNPQAGSGSNRYYSFNYGNTHFIVLDEYQDFSPGSMQYNWLVSDLDSPAAVSAAWRIVLGHRPVYHTYSRAVPNYLNGNMYSFQRSGDGSYAYISYETNPAITLGGTDTSMRIDYSIPAGGWAGVLAELKKSGDPGADLTGYNAVSFWVRGSVGGEIFKIGLKDNAASVPTEVTITNYASITTSWQKVNIPFSAFSGVQFNNMSQFTLAFTNGLDGAGRIYVDNIVFEKITADFSASPSAGSSPLNVTFTNRSSGTITNYLWDFGDGATSSLQNPSHTYSQASGVFTVTLTVTGPDGADVRTKTDYIVVVPCPATLMLDDYNDGVMNPNPLGFWEGWGRVGASTMADVQLHKTDSAGYNRARKITFNYTPSSGDYIWYSTNLWNNTVYLNVSGYNYLSFRVKGEAGNEGCIIKIEHSGSGVSQLNFSGITNEWQQVNIPLSSFVGLDKTRVRAVSFICDSNFPGSSVTFYLDNLQFSNGYGKQQSTGHVKIDRQTRRLLLDGQIFDVKGIGYQPAPIGTAPPFADDPSLYDRDFPLLEGMGCNTIRAWGLPGSNMLAKADEYGLKVIAGFWMGITADYSDPIVRETVKSEFADFISNYKNSPAILVWAIGNENNYHNGNDAFYYSICNELAQIAYQEEGAGYHPVMIVNGSLFNIGNYMKFAEDLALNYIDIWGTNVYLQHFNNINWYGEVKDYFEIYEEETAKPLIITEYGADAFYTTSSSPVVTGYEDEDSQAAWVRQNALEIAEASGVCIGGCVMEYSDEWWKYPAGSPETHDKGGFSTASWGDVSPDDYANEEYWGVMQVAPDGTWGAADGLDDIKPRKVYETLKDIYAANNIVMPGESIQSAIETAASGDNIYVSAGTYESDIVTQGKVVHLTGEDAAGTIIKGSVSFVNSDSSIKNLSIWYEGGGFITYSSEYYSGLEIINDSGITAINSGITVTGCVIEPDSAIFGSDKFGKAIQIWSLYDNPDISPIIDNCEISNADTGIYFYSQAFGGAILGEIKNNTLDNNNYGITLRMHKEKPLIIDNEINNSINGIHITYEGGALLTQRLSRITPTNVFTGNERDIYCDETGIKNNIVISTDTVWPSGTYNYDSVTIQAGKTLTVNGPASLKGSIKGHGTLIIQGGLFTATTIQAGSVVMRNGGSVRAGSTSGDSLTLG